MILMIIEHYPVNRIDLNIDVQLKMFLLILDLAGTRIEHEIFQEQYELMTAFNCPIFTFTSP